MSKKKRIRLLTDYEIDDCITALRFFCNEYFDRRGSIETRKAMKKLENKLWGRKSPAQGEESR